MTIAQAFCHYLNDLGVGTFDLENPESNDIFIGSAPLKGPDSMFWVKTNGGSPVSLNTTGERRKNYTLSVYYRSKSARQVDEVLQNLEEQINIDQCTQLQGFDTIDFEASSFASDQDIDNEDRTVGLLQITITTYL